MASAKRLPNEAMPPPNSKDQREFLKQAEAQRRAEEAAAAERRRKAAARGAASSDAKFEQAAEDEEQAMKDKQSKDAYERVKPQPFRKGGSAKKYAEGGDTSSKKSRSMTAKEKEAYVDRVTAPVRSVGKNVGRRLERIGAAGLSTLGGAALGASGAIERLRDKDESDRYFKRSRNSLRSAGRSAKAVFAGEPDDNIEGKYIDAAGDMIPGAEKVYRRGGNVKKYASGGSVSSASKRADGCATKGKTKGRFV